MKSKLAYFAEDEGQSEIDTHLKTAFQTVLDAEVPERFIQLIQKLREKEQDLNHKNE